jgi:hypothetical protein
VQLATTMEACACTVVRIMDNKVGVQFAQVKRLPEADGGEGTAALLKVCVY